MLLLFWALQLVLFIVFLKSSIPMCKHDRVDVFVVHVKPNVLFTMWYYFEINIYLKCLVFIVWIYLQYGYKKSIPCDKCFLKKFWVFKCIAVVSICSSCQTCCGAFELLCYIRTTLVHLDHITPPLLNYLSTWAQTLVHWNYLSTF